MRQLTLIALFGNKPPALSRLVTDCQERLAGFFPGTFSPYPLEQVHATLLGLERSPGSALTNRNLAQYRGVQSVMDIKGLLAFLCDGGDFPWRVQIGGFRDRDYPFTSRGARPFRRSFSIQDAKAVLMGWPIRGKPIPHPDPTPLDLAREAGLYPPALDDLRRKAQEYNLLHAYHRHPEDVDNDCYFRIGLFEPHESLDSGAILAAETALRDHLAALEPFLLEIKRSDLRLASYTDETLTPVTTGTWPVSDPRLTPDFISNLYLDQY